jgi:biopolymer transport protein ExbD
MSMNVGSDDDDEEALNSTINTTPLVDVMLVLLIIFLITIPVVVQQVPLTLPKETNQPTQTKPENIVLAINREGDIFWNTQPVDMPNLLERLRGVAVMVPQPAVHIRADQEARYEFVGRVMVACQRMSIFKVAFITEPPPKGG